jgi:hypothetical protein
LKYDGVEFVIVGCVETKSSKYLHFFIYAANAEFPTSKTNLLGKKLVAKSPYCIDPQYN